SQDMIDHDFFDHPGSDGSQPADRMAASGYPFENACPPVGSCSFVSGENISWRGTTGSPPNQTTTASQEHDDLFIDSAVTGRGHRKNILNPDFKEVGTGLVSGVFTYNAVDYNTVMATEDFAYVNPSAFLTGVAYNDNVT